ncbi:hypothetical protein V5T82_07255 [Magnetovibrio sp. PR-2]|uniref:hypothetical protein n=1 Tax=Magnetovibrio sp. PR-2 TaxID=3120356 RepID=UPI002FCE453A
MAAKPKTKTPAKTKPVEPQTDTPVQEQEPARPKTPTKLEKLAADLHGLMAEQKIAVQRAEDANASLIKARSEVTRLDQAVKRGQTILLEQVRQGEPK